MAIDTCVLLMAYVIRPHACADLIGVGVKEGIGYALALPGESTVSVIKNG